MSFADRLREELVQITVKKPCCRKALTFGLLSIAEIDEHKQICLRYRQEVSAKLAAQMIRSLYGLPNSMRISSEVL